MTAQSSGPLWSRWQGIAVICAVILAGQALSTWYLARQQIDVDTLGQLLDERKSRTRRGGGGGGGRAASQDKERADEGEPTEPTEPPQGAEGWTLESAEATQRVGQALDEGEGADHWSLESSDAVQRWDALMQQRVERLAAEKGIDPVTVMPAGDLRERALASGDLRSEEAQELIAEYSRVLRELGTTTQD